MNECPISLLDNTKNERPKKRGKTRQIHQEDYSFYKNHFGKTKVSIATTLSPRLSKLLPDGHSEADVFWHLWKQMNGWILRNWPKGRDTEGKESPTIVLVKTIEPGRGLQAPAGVEAAPSAASKQQTARMTMSRGGGGDTTTATSTTTRRNSHNNHHHHHHHSAATSHHHPHRHFAAARLPAGREHPITLTKNGVFHTQFRPDHHHRSSISREIIACGLACSECFSGPQLHKVLQSGWEYERMVMEQLAAVGADAVAAPPLFVQRSGGVSEPLGDFLTALAVHLPWKKKKNQHKPHDEEEEEEELDWCVSLQVEGASAVFAAIDMLLQVSRLETAGVAGTSSAGEKQQQQPPPSKQKPPHPQRIKVAVGATSYHGPASTCFGAKTPIWPKEHQLHYPVPMADGSHGDETKLLAAYETFLDQYGDQIGVILFEPQWGSSQAALPWPQHLLKTYIAMAKERGIKVICDEIMCGLGRHGQGTTLFLSQAWDLDPDAITFGKAIATGVFPLSGAIIKTGQTLLKAKKCTVLQSHTYAGSSVRALMAATAVLQEIVPWLPHVARLGDAMTVIMASLTKISHGLFFCHGQGLMWGGTITHHGPCRDENYRRQVIQAFKTCCDQALIVPYYVPLGGFMISPVLDVDITTIYEIGHRLERAVVMTMAAVGWMVSTIEEEEVRGDHGALFAVVDETKEEPIVMA